MAKERFAGLPEIVKYALWLLTICLVLLSTDLLWRWDQLIYDTQQRLTSRPAPDDVLIVAIDEASLAELGRWPWRRQLHASLIDRLTQEGARVIAMDVIFAEPDSRYPQDDLDLIRAVADSGRVVLPVLVEQTRQASVLHETLPLPGLVENSAALGHVHVELDPDGIARSVYLFEGLGSPRWPAFSLATLQLAEPDRSASLPGIKRQSGEQAIGQLTWARDYFVKIPYLGPPGHFDSISYYQVLQGRYPRHLFRDKIVFVGVTATGLGDSLPTPVSGLSRAMPGVEINATVLAGIRSERMITDIPAIWRYVLSVFLVLLPVILYPKLRPRLAWFSTLFLLFITLLVNTVLIRYLHVWFGPVAVLVTLILSYPLWSWRRLEFTMRYMDDELALLNQQRGIPIAEFEIEADIALNYISRWMPLIGFVLYSREQERLFEWGLDPKVSRHGLLVEQWVEGDDDTYWYQFAPENGGFIIGVKWRHPQQPDTRQTSVLLRLAHRIKPQTNPMPKSTFEVIQSRTQLVHQATNELRNLKRFIETTLDQMADAVLVVNSFGQVILCNVQAKQMFAKGEDLTGQWVMPLLERVQLAENHRWPEIFKIFYNSNETIQVQARLGNEFDILVNISPMYMGEEYKYDAVVVNVANITNLVESERRRKEALSFLSHDLRSPLSSILGLTQLMTIPKQQENLETNLARISNYAWRTIQLAEEFVQISRMEGNEQVPFNDIDIVDIVSNAIDQVWEQAQSKQISLRRNLQFSECLYTGNAQLLERAFVNLLTNAIKYSKESTEVEFYLGKQDNFIICRVSDQGFGIPEEDIPYIMDRFRRVEKGQHMSMQGLGLGLAFVKVVMERHGGTIHINSEAGTGTSIELRLPLPSND